MKSTTLRQQLFRSHLVVMVVAVGVMIASVAVLGTLLAIITDGRGPFDEGKGRGDPGALGPLALMGVVGAAVVAATLVGWRMAGRLARPMEDLGEATREIAEGNYDVAVAANGVAELDRLGEDVKALADALETTEARRLMLIGDIAHELRTPLSTIEGSMEALMDGVVPATDETFAGIAREAARLRRLAGDLSALSSSAEHDPLRTAEPVDVVELVGEVVDLLGVQAEAKDLELTLDDTSSRPLIVMGDRDRLSQVATNVVGNAIQYTDTGVIDVRVAQSGPMIEIEVADTGRGLTEEERSAVFERFYRADEHFADGTGVGLTIAQQIVRAHGGSIRAESPGPGAGSTFVITLPAGA